jgi:hypothetical protein
MKGHVYVPIRFVAEHLGATIDHDAELHKIFVKNSDLDLTDPEYEGISVGNLILTKAGTATKVTGQLIIAGVGSTQNMIEARLSFYNDNSKQIGEVIIKGNKFGVFAQTFVGDGVGDFRAYSAVNLQITKVNNQSIPEASSILYTNTIHQFTLALPKTGEGKYEVVEAVNEVSGTERLDFIDTANKEYAGVIFSILIWSKEDWKINSPSMIEIGQIYKIGEDGNKVFTLNPPGDVNYNPNDAELTATYQSMSKQINQIRTTFKLIN